MSEVNVGGIRATASLDVSDIGKGTALASRQVATFSAELDQRLKAAAAGAEQFAARCRQALSGANLGASAGQFEAFSTRVKASMAGVTDAANKAAAASKRWKQDFQELGQVFAGFGAAATAALAVSSKSFLDFDQKMRNFNSLAKQSETQFSRTAEQVGKMAVQLKTGQNSTQLAEALTEIQSSSFEGADGLEVLRVTALAAKGGVTDAQTATTGLTQSLNSFGATAKDAEHFADVMFQTVDKGVITFPVLSREIGVVASFAKGAGVSFEEMNAAIQVMTQRGSQGSTAIANLRQLLLRLTVPTKIQRKALQEYGIELSEHTLRQKGLLNVLREIQGKTGGENKKIGRVLGGGTEAFDAFQKLTELDKGKLLGQRIKETQGADGKLLAAVGEQNKAEMAPFDQIRVNIDQAMKGVGKGVVEALKPATLAIRDLTERFALLPSKTQGTIGLLGGVGAAALTAAGGFLLLAPGIASAGAAAARIASMFGPAINVIRAAGVAIAAIGSGPILALTAATAALGAAWVNDWGGMRALVSEVTTSIVQSASSAAKYFKDNFAPLFSEIATRVSVAWKEGLLPAINWVGEHIASVLVPAARKGLAIFGGLWEAAAFAVKVSVANASAALETIGRATSAVVTTVGLIITGDWAAAWDNWVQAVENIVPRFAQIMNRLVDEVRSAGTRMRENLSSAFQDVFYGLRDQGEMGVNSNPVVNAAGELYNRFKSSGGGVLAQGKDLFKQFTAGAQKRIKPVLAALPPARDPYQDLLAQGQEAQEKYAADHAKKARATKPKLNRGQMSDYIRRNADVTGNIDGLDKATLEATYRLIDNAVQNRVRLALTSAYRSNSSTFHGAGMAVDVAAPGLDRKVAPAALKGLAQNTGFRSGINEYDPAARAWTGGTGDHMHLTTGMERLGNTGVFALDGKVRQGTRDLMGDLEKYKVKLSEFATSVYNFMAAPPNQFEQQRREIAKDLAKLQKESKELGLPEGVLGDAKKAAVERLAEVDRLEKSANKKTLSELTMLKFEAEGRMGEAARARIEQEKNDELERLRLLKKEYPLLAKDIDSAMEAINKSASTRGIQAGAGIEMGQMGDQADLAGQMRALGVGSLEDIRSQLTGVGSEIQKYLSLDGLAPEAQLEQLRSAVQLLTQQRDTMAQISDERLRQVDFEAQMGTITKEQRLAAYAEDLNLYTANDETKRQKMVEYSELYAEHLAQTLEMQGEFNLETILQMEEALTQSGEMTNAKMAELGALRQMHLQLEMADTQQRMQMVTGLEGSFANFFQGVLTGQTSMGEGLKSAWKSISSMILGELAKWIAKALVFRLIMGAIGGIFGLGSAAAAGPMSLANPGAIPFLGVAHTGGWAQNLPSYFHDGGMVGNVPQLRSDEVAAVLQTGEYVMSRDDVRSARGGQAPNVSVTIHASVSNEVDIDALGRRLAIDIQRRLQGRA